MPIITEMLQLPPPPPGPPGIFALADASTLAAFVVDAGFRDVTTGAIQVIFATDTPEQFTAFIQDVAPAIAALVDGKPPDVRERVWDNVTAGWAPFQDAAGRVWSENQEIWVVGAR